MKRDRIQETRISHQPTGLSVLGALGNCFLAMAFVVAVIGVLDFSFLPITQGKMETMMKEFLATTEKSELTDRSINEYRNTIEDAKPFFLLAYSVVVGFFGIIGLVLRLIGKRMYEN